ncbi:MAG: hypothetical protein DDG59_00655 [Anaerolineae bacterium]|nr:MAG: hypothetical protein DDG59_00655 [Anaerolineae bacterium]
MKPPVFVTIVFIGVLITGTTHLIGVIEVFRQWATLQEFIGNLLYYVLFSNLALSLVAMGVLIAIWVRLHQAKWLILGYFSLFLLFYWLDRLVFFQDDKFIRFPFAVAFQIVMASVLWLGLRCKSVRLYFGEIHG